MNVRYAVAWPEWAAPFYSPRGTRSTVDLFRRIVTLARIIRRNRRSGIWRYP